MNNPYGYINGRVRMMRVELLESRSLDEVQNAATYPEYLRQLSETSLREDLGEATAQGAGLGQLDEALSRNYLRSVQKLRSIVTGQPVEEAKRDFARRMRKEPTPAERVLWQAVRGKQVGGFKFRRQQPIDGFIVDFYCHTAALFREVDGGIHETQREADEEREAIIRRHELLCLRFANHEVLHALPHVVARILETCQARRPTPTSPF